MRRIENILLVVNAPADYFLAGFGGKFLRQPALQLTILDCNPLHEADGTRQRLESELPKALVVVRETRAIDEEFLQRFDLMLISLSSWHTLQKQKAAWLPNSPSVLIIKSPDSTHHPHLYHSCSTSMKRLFKN